MFAQELQQFCKVLAQSGERQLHKYDQPSALTYSEKQKANATVTESLRKIGLCWQKTICTVKQ